MRRQIVIELTSLLDVILILLFLVIYNTTGSASEIENNNKQQMTEMTSQMEQMQNELDNKSSMLESIEAVDGECTVITVRGTSDPYDPNNDNGKNKITFTINKEVAYEVPLILDKNYIYNTIYSYMQECYTKALQQDDTIIYVVYDRTGASRHEPDAVENAYNIIRRKHLYPSNVYYKEIMSEQ